MNTQENGKTPFLDQASRDMAFNAVRSMLDTPKETKNGTRDFKWVPDHQIVKFLNICERVKLDPNLGQIWAVPPYGKSGELVAMTGILSIGIIADRTGKFDGFQSVEWCGPDGQWLDVWTSTDNPAAARATGWRKDRRFPAVFVAKWDEFSGFGDFWKRMDTHMIAKCAKKGAYTELFPDLLSDLFSEEEEGALQYGSGWSPEREALDMENRKKESEEAAKRLSTQPGVRVVAGANVSPQNVSATDPIDSHKESAEDQTRAAFHKAHQKEPETQTNSEEELPDLNLKLYLPEAPIYHEKVLGNLEFKYIKKLFDVYVPKVRAKPGSSDISKTQARQIELRYRQMVAEIASATQNEPDNEPYEATP